MRISDWISDVCSSDLVVLGRGDGLLRLAEFDLKLLQLGGRAVVDSGVGEPRLEGGLLPVQPLDLGLGLLGRLAQVGDGGAGLGGGEIGRASCRERVCPYV